MKLSRNLRAGSRVMSGPSGSPPTGLRGFEVVDADPNGPPVLDRPQASVAHRRDGAAGWLRAAGEWVSLGALGALSAATNAFGYLIALGSYLPALLGSLGQGWRAPVVVHDAAFNAASVTVAGLSSAKRYRCLLACDANGANESQYLQPDASAAGLGMAYTFNNGGPGEQGTMAVGHMPAAGNSRVSQIAIEPRRLGLSKIDCTVHGAGTDDLGLFSFNQGATSTDFTSLKFILAAVSRTGWLTVIEESP